MEFKVCSGDSPDGLREVERIGILLNEGKMKSGKCGLDKEKERASDGGRERRLRTGRNKRVLAWRGGKRLARGKREVFWIQKCSGLRSNKKFTMVTIVSTKIAWALRLLVVVAHTSGSEQTHNPAY